MDDLFEAPLPNPHPEPKVGRDHPETSHEAAEKVRPYLPNIRARVLDALMRAGAAGFTDDELALELPDILINSLRPSRCGLTDELWVLDSGDRRENLQGNDCIVWVHRDFHPSAPALAEASKSASKADRDALRAEAAEIARKLPPEIAYLKGEGRAIIARYLERAVFVLAALSQPGA